ncbi:hypothetical protein FB446DRAFT_501453 [Lentinula raphanica]|nr:hypothetical protein FB446DRAFT_501453 [Lentinula raphanica]
MSATLKKRLSKNDLKIQWIQSNLDRIEALQPADFQQQDHPLCTEILEFIRGNKAKTASWETFFRNTNSATTSEAIKDTEAEHVLLTTYIRYMQCKEGSDEITHQEKRQLLLNIGLNFKKYSVHDAVVRGDNSVTLPCGTKLKLVRRDRKNPLPFKQHTRMYDIEVPHMEKGAAAVVDEKSGFKVVPVTDSVLFYSGGTLAALNMFLYTLSDRTMIRPQNFYC